MGKHSCERRYYDILVRDISRQEFGHVSITGLFDPDVSLKISRRIELDADR
jgi:hypothetical protein